MKAKMVFQIEKEEEKNKVKLDIAEKFQALQQKNNITSIKVRHLFLCKNHGKTMKISASPRLSLRSAKNQKKMRVTLRDLENSIPWSGER